MMYPESPKEPRKNDFKYHEKNLPRNDDKPERGGCLSAFLVLNIFANGLLLLVVLGAFFALRSSGEYETYFDPGLQALVYFGFVLLVIRVISAIGLWKWKRWGYIGLMACFAIAIVLGLIGGDLVEVVRSVVWGGILYAMVKPIEPYLD